MIVSRGRHGAAYGSSSGGSRRATQIADARTTPEEKLREISGAPPTDFEEAYRGRMEYLQRKYPNQPINEENVRRQLEAEYSSGALRSAADAEKYYSSSSLASRAAQHEVMRQAVEKMHGKAVMDYSLPKNERKIKYQMEQAAVDERRMSEEDRLRRVFVEKNSEGKVVELHGFEYEGKKYFGAAAAVKLRQLAGEGKASYTLHSGGVEIRFRDRYSPYPDVVVGRPTEKTKEGMRMHEMEYSRRERHLLESQKKVDDDVRVFQRSILGIPNSPWLPLYEPKLPKENILRGGSIFPPMTSVSTTATSTSPPYGQPKRFSYVAVVSTPITKFVDRVFGVDYSRTEYHGTPEEYEKLSFLEKVAYSRTYAPFRGVDEKKIRAVEEYADKLVSEQRKRDAEARVIFSQVKAAAGGAAIFSPGVYTSTRTSDVEKLEREYFSSSKKYYDEVGEWKKNVVGNIREDAISWLKVGGVELKGVPGNVKTASMVLSGGLLGAYAIGVGLPAFVAGEGVKGMMIRSAAAVGIGTAASEGFRTVGMPIVEAGYPYVMRSSPLFYAAKAMGKEKEYMGVVESVRPYAMFGVELAGTYKLYGAAAAQASKISSAAAGVPKTTTLTEPEIVVYESAKPNKIDVGGRKFTERYYTYETLNPGKIQLTSRLSKTPYYDVSLKQDIGTYRFGDVDIFHGRVGFSGYRAAWYDRANQRIAGFLDTVSRGRYGGYTPPQMKASYDIFGVVRETHAGEGVRYGASHIVAHERKGKNIFSFLSQVKSSRFIEDVEKVSLRGENILEPRPKKMSISRAAEAAVKKTSWIWDPENKNLMWLRGGGGKVVGKYDVSYLLRGIGDENIIHRLPSGEYRVVGPKPGKANVASRVYGGESLHLPTKMQNSLLLQSQKNIIGAVMGRPPPATVESGRMMMMLSPQYMVKRNRAPPVPTSTMRLLPLLSEKKLTPMHEWMLGVDSGVSHRVASTYQSLSEAVRESMLLFPSVGMKTAPIQKTAVDAKLRISPIAPPNGQPSGFLPIPVIPPTPPFIPLPIFPLLSRIYDGGPSPMWTASRYVSRHMRMRFARWDEVLAALTGVVPKRMIKEIKTIDDLIKIPRRKNRIYKRRRGKK